MKIELSLVLLLAVCAFCQNNCGPPGRVCRDSGECCKKYCQHDERCGQEPSENPCSNAYCPGGECWIVDVKQADGTWKPTSKCVY
ncbi:hypothetical protein HCN44_002695 [Aphidius gifuensis]|uniref:Uncharacterized protein n=1 Tax=Aphidius gifuensis TaxID=684658 RepID=A0A834XRA7_APHGI|nr:hypothetical protein HCN44_002695 [Aphidius gifuensis]